MLPLATLTLSMIPGDYLLIRNSMMLTIREPYVLTACAKGIKKRRIKYLHAARNAILPFSTRIGIRIAYIITGALFIEKDLCVPRDRESDVQRDIKPGSSADAGVSRYQYFWYS